jgi:hypothetical protein
MGFNGKVKQLDFNSSFDYFFLKLWKRYKWFTMVCYISSCSLARWTSCCIRSYSSRYWFHSCNRRSRNLSWYIITEKICWYCQRFGERSYTTIWSCFGRSCLHWRHYCCLVRIILLSLFFFSIIKPINMFIGVSLI